jgi:hypothetical protein
MHVFHFLVYRKNELMTSSCCGETMTIWLLADPHKAVHRLAEWSLVMSGRVVSLDRFPDSGRVISLHKDGHLAVWNPFGDSSCSAEPLVPGVTQNLCAVLSLEDNGNC